MTSSPREAETRIGPIGALLCRVVFLSLWLPGPVLLAVAVTLGPSRSPTDFWGLLAGGALATVVGVGSGVFGWRLVTRSRRDARRLAAGGVAATAEIIAVTNHLGGEDPGLELRLRVSGPGFATFEAETVRADDPALVPGASLPAVVDPVDRLFAITGRATAPPDRPAARPPR
ncbi:hypothetical protein [Micromonospora cathayae]|uniref:Uncharacterized protein n=1 Tax=Micromonospora cathayae TaxID=3028804 RepID=A0ABY7ZJ06_9ACTN|nr:hypothetical protein [Micromonospora sp. HUAS 3]WDZ82421.1 hypothetical protein PVK37_18230 [Micromonospora sp. HUAS 3]